jgi:hypothetical protein
MPTPDPTNPALFFAQAKTVLLFEMFLHVGYPPPVHSATGIPKPDNCFGYAGMFDLLWSRGCFGPPKSPYYFRVAVEHDRDPVLVVAAFITAAPAPANAAEALAVKAATRALFADYQRRNFIPGVPLTDGLPADVRWQMAYAAMAQALK